MATNMTLGFGQNGYPVTTVSMDADTDIFGQVGFYETVTNGWGEDYLGVANANIAKINGVVIANIAKVNGK